MQALAAHSSRPKKGRRRWPWVVAAAVVIAAAGAGGYAFALTRGRGTTTGGTATKGCKKGSSCAKGVAVAADAPLGVTRTTPAAGAKGVASNTTMTVQFSEPIRPGGPMPTLTPPVKGTWQLSGRSKLVFEPAAPFVPFTTYTVTIPGGSDGVVSTGGRPLGASDTVTFTVAAGSTLRLQQLLAMLDFLPLSYAEPSGVTPHDMAEPQSGTLTWRWKGTPLTLMAVWSQGEPNEVTKAAVMQFEAQNGLAVDGIAGEKVWATLLDAVAFGKTNSEAYTYVLVTKGLPQHLTAWVNGNLKFHHILVNTGVPGATTTDGTFAVFEHLRASTMIGTNVTGSHYDDPTVPWASYFNGGDALHGFPRARYGYPQSNGCVEMNISTAGALWPYTPIGTLVAVIG